jgi:signal transduction histidine kinase
MQLSQKAMSLFHVRRPVLRVQLTMLYSGLFIGLLAAVLLATNVVFFSSETSTQQRVPVYHVNFGPIVISLVAVLVALAAAWWLAGRFLRPLRSITTTAQDISATNLHRRLDLSGPDDELKELGRTLNDLFGRLEASFEAQRHFVANASHELRTPLAGQRTLLQVALADPKASTESLRAACEEALQLGGQQEQFIDALLTLATSEGGVEQWEPCDLGQIAETVLLGRRQEAERRGIQIDTTLMAAPAAGDPRLIERLVANLVDNAMLHNLKGGRVEVSTNSAPGRATISMSNTGPAIASAELERLFQPFQKVGGERLSHTNGHGFGLAIVQAIAQAHGAKVVARPGVDGGLGVQVSFFSSRPL